MRMRQLALCVFASLLASAQPLAQASTTPDDAESKSNDRKHSKDSGDKANDSKKSKKNRDSDEPKQKTAKPKTTVDRKPVNPDADVTTAVAALLASDNGPTRMKLGAALIASSAGNFNDGDDASTRVTALQQFLTRQHASSEEERRDVLREIKASVPDKSGKFSNPGRQSSDKNKADDELDWLAELSRLAERPGLADVMSDVVVLRALAATKTDFAADVLFDAAFNDATMMYRDECGRYLRTMQPSSLPVLTRQSQGDGDRRRYATFQLERIDRQEPGKALTASLGDEAILIAVLEAFRMTRHREAVHAVFGQLNSDSPRVRAAARTAWMDYITGPPPPAAPRKRLVLPGGKLANKETPLWLTSRELAENELRVASDEILGEAIDEKTKIDLEAVSKKLFAHLDQDRSQVQRGQWSAARAMAEKGDLDGAVAVLGQVLANDPDHPDKIAMAKIYLDHAKSHESKNDWAVAASSYSAAAGLDEKSSESKTVMAAHYYALGKAQQAAGKDGGPAFKRAIQLRPESAPAKKAAAATAPPGAPRWLLVGAGGAALLSIIFAAIGFRRRKSS
jgi:hypothetical protein